MLDESIRVQHTKQFVEIRLGAFIQYMYSQPSADFMENFILHLRRQVQPFLPVQAQAQRAFRFLRGQG